MKAKRLRYLGVADLRILKVAELRELGKDVIVVTNHGAPIAAIVGYEQFLKMQELLKKEG